MGCSKEGGGGGLAGDGGEGPTGYGTGINEGFDGKIELDVRDSTPDWKPFELKKAPEGAPGQRRHEAGGPRVIFAHGSRFGGHTLFIRTPTPSRRGAPCPLGR